MVVDVKHTGFEHVWHDNLVVTYLSAQESVVTYAKGPDLPRVYLPSDLLTEGVGELGGDQFFMGNRRKGRITWEWWGKGREDLIRSNVVEVCTVNFVVIRIDRGLDIVEKAAWFFLRLFGTVCQEAWYLFHVFVSCFAVG